MLEFFKRRRKIEAPQPTAPNRSDTYEPPKHEILNDWDKKMLEEGLTNVVREMMKDFQGLPDAILLPDTSARPLLYALLPIFKRLNEVKGTHTPHFYFFNSERPDAGVMLGEQFKSSDGDLQTIDTKEDLALVFEEHGMPKNVYAPLLEISSPEKMVEARKTMGERAEEILSHEKTPHPKIAVIDDSVTAAATTASEIRRAFRMPTMHVYAILAQEADTVQAGVTVDPYDRTSMNPGHHHTARFSYTGRNAVGVTKASESHQKYSERIPHNPLRPIPENKKQLREEMRTIGEKIAESIV